MKKLSLIIFIIPFFVFGQGFKTPEIKYRNQHLDASVPQWIKLMYSENPDPGQVAFEYQKFYHNNPFVKNTHTQYYKRWQRSFSRDVDYTLNSSQRNTDLKRFNDEYVLQSKQLKNTKGPNSQWQGIGPIDFDKGAAGVSYAAGAGHVYALEQSVINDSVLYCGTATAGVWKSTNKGEYWELVTSDVLVNSVVALEIDPTNDNIVYFGGGDKLYKTTDGGISWNTIGDANFNNEEHYIPEIKIHPTNASLLFVCSDNGFYRSTDAGNNFVEILDGDFQEMEFHPTNPNIIYTVKEIGEATQFFKSVDGGLTFTQKITGWPVPAVGDEQKRTEIATSSADPTKVYALCTGEANGGTGLYGLYVSNDLGESWSRTCCGPQVGGVPSANNQNLMGWDDAGLDDGGQFYYDLALEVDETNADKIYVGAVNLWVSTDGGVTFTCPSKWSHSYKPNYVHADIHDIKSIGNDLWLSCDGGAFYSSTQGNIIDRKMLGIQATDFWGFGAGYWDGEVIIGGTYHNGTLLKDNEVYLNGWLSTGGGDNVRGFVNPGDERRVYQDYGEFELSGDRNVNHTSLNFYKLPNASYTVGQSSDIAFHPYSYNSAYVGKEGDLWLTHDDGLYYELVHNFGNTEVTSIEVAPSNPDYIYVATYSGWWDNKKIWKTIDGGDNWIDITPSGAVQGGELWIPFDITVDHLDENTVWIARTSMYGGYPNYDGNQIYKSTDAGATWSNYSTATLNGVYPTNIVHQAGSNGGVYLGTRKAVYYRDNTLNDWQLFNNNLPVSTHSVKLIPYYREGKIRNGTNRSAFECEMYGNSSPIAGVTRDRLDELYCPGDYVQFKERSVMHEASSQWEWTFEGGFPATSTERDPIVTYNTFGEFDVTLTVTDTFGTNTKVLDNFIVVDDCFGWDTVVDGINKSMVKKLLDIYPTIVAGNGILNIKNIENQQLTFKLYNAKGKLVEADDVKNNQVMLNGLSSGTYFISIIGEKSILNKQIVVE